MTSSFSKQKVFRNGFFVASLHNPLLYFFLGVFLISSSRLQGRDAGTFAFFPPAFPARHLDGAKKRLAT